MSETQADDIERMSFRVPRDLLRAVDLAVEEEGYMDRSEAGRDALREFVGEKRLQRVKSNNE